MRQSRFVEHLYNMTGIPAALICDGEPKKIFCVDEEAYEKRFLRDGGVIQLIGEMDGRDLLVRDISENIWVFLVKGGEDVICVTGPVAIKNNEVKRKGLQKMEHRQYVELILMVYEFFTGKEMTVRELFDMYGEGAEKISQWRSGTVESLTVIQEYKRPHHSQAYEQRVLDAIRDGRSGEFIKLYDEPIDGYYGVLAHTKSRSSRNLGIAAITLFTRAAIIGGASSEQALTLSDAYINQIELMDKWEDVYNFCRDCGTSFANLVAQKQPRAQAHMLADRCENLILSRIHEHITVRELADALSVNADYLSRLFHESVGMTIGDYIQQKKINLASNMLIYSQYSLEEIANYLGFSSQSHFGRIFKKLMGLTPGQYRRQYTPTAFSDKNPESKG